MPEIPGPPGDGTWENWIIRIAVAVVLTMTATVTFLAKFIQSIYITRISSLEKQCTENCQQISELHKLGSKCLEERAEIRGEYLVLKSENQIIRQQLEDIRKPK